ncbi:TIGR01777 family oxidoreductase [Luteitalea pratensis]|nr:TIGR01777 family oxidoreductase [Luteitalea pratensis]
MRIAITGASGLVGSALVPFLQGTGHDVIRLVRGTPRSPDEHRWSPDSGIVDASTMGPVDAVIHLAGESVAGGRWTPAMKARIRDSRIGPTRALARSLADAPVPPRVLISASAMGIYGDRGDEVLTESSPRGGGFLADVCEAWEAAAEPARAAGIRVVHPRFGIILDARGGALGKMTLPFRLGLGGRLGPGTQHWSWVSIADVLGALLFAAAHDQVRGPINVTAPHSVTNAEFTQSLGRVLHRPAVMPVPAVVLRAVIGEMAQAELLSSKRVLPAALQRADFEFRYPRLEDALRYTLGRRAAMQAG